MNPIKYLAIADAAARFSKDTTHVGAALIGVDGEGGPWGYNGATRGSLADEGTDPRKERPEKYWWYEHAERNAIYAAARVGYPTKGCTMVVTHPPCMDCARALVQSGIKKVIWRAGDDAFNQRWWEHRVRVLALFEECGVDYDEVPR
jgi:dCMP deaminase